MNMIRNLNIILIFSLITGCSLAPGMHLDTEKSWFNEKQYVYIESIGETIEIKSINTVSNQNKKRNQVYRIGPGDMITVAVWGLPEIFPMVNISADQNLRRVDQNGNIFFPYAGLTQASNKTQDELRLDLTNALSVYFNEPQVDVTISRFNSQQVFVLGEVTRPLKANITDVPLSLSDALGNSLGLNKNTAEKMFL